MVQTVLAHAFLTARYHRHIAYGLYCQTPKILAPSW